MRGSEGGATRGRQEMMARQPAGAMRQQEAARRDDQTTRGRRVERHPQQPAGATRGQEGGTATRGRGEAMRQQAGATS
jgi:hypothetical protein